MIEINPRAMMELAIEQMKKSVNEPRKDGKVAPKVGAVLINIADQAPGYDRTMKAYRGELRYGDHAEFTLLERKHRDRLLEDCVLFATLEPYLVLTIFLNPEAAIAALPKEIATELNDSEREGWQWLALKGDTSTKEYATHMGVDPRTARRHLNRFVELQLAQKEGEGSKTRYQSR